MFLWQSCTGEEPTVLKSMMLIQSHTTVNHVHKIGFKIDRFDGGELNEWLFFTLGVLLEESRMLEGLMSLWTTHCSVPLCRYIMASAVPTATLYLTDHGSGGRILFPFLFFLAASSLALKNQKTPNGSKHKVFEFKNIGLVEWFRKKKKQDLPCKWRSKLPPETYLYTRKRPSSGSMQKPKSGTTFGWSRELAIISSLQNAFGLSLSSMSNRFIATAVLNNPTLPLNTQLHAPLPNTLPAHIPRFKNSKNSALNNWTLACNSTPTHLYI